ncbi:MAG: phenylalanine--tRNA ligase subunit beta [Nitrospirae bacterium RBG_16_64_22]|nr:MAG: phenylalanine--tRNA ligase subunit beta [Nitrospirae bacterium RBG_16_64_22]
MRLSLNWLREFVDITVSPEELAHRLTMAGFEVEGIHRMGEGIGDVVVAEVLTVRRHPNADKLSLCDVSDGERRYAVVCGAPNVRAGAKAPLARPGASLPGGVTIKKSKIRGEVSEGMLCSERELGLAKESDGICLLPESLSTGRPIVEALGIDDVILEVAVTPNRPDALSVLGLAREVSALFGLPLRLPPTDVAESGEPISALARVDVTDTVLCPRYAARVIRGVTVGPSPMWLVRRIEAAGLRPINNVVDVTNYVLMEMGQPLHAFDLAHVAESRLIVDRASAGEKIVTLDGCERILDREILTIRDTRGPLAVAGVMGGEGSGVSAGTGDVMLESAYFLPSAIRRTSKALGVASESSYRFERGVDPENVVRALDRAARLILEVAGGSAAGGRIDVRAGKAPEKTVTVGIDRLGRRLGKNIGAAEAAGILGRLGFGVTMGGEMLSALVPSHRVDIAEEVDLVEEIARLHGYDAIPETIPIGRPTPPIPGTRWVLAREARAILAGMGFDEAVHLSFTDDVRISSFLPEADIRRRMPRLANPLAEDAAFLRGTAWTSLLDTWRRNESRGADRGRLFEVTTVFAREASGVAERVVLAGLIAGSREPEGWWGRPPAADFFDAKGVVEGIAAALDVMDADVVRGESDPLLHPGRQGRLTVAGRDAGSFGEIHPDLVKAWGLSAVCLLFELDLDVLAAGRREGIRFARQSNQPSVERDLAVMIDSGVPYAEVHSVMSGVEDPKIEKFFLFDQYAGAPLPSGRKSLGLRVVYRLPDRTLTEEEVGTVQTEIVRRLRDRLGAEVRGAGSPGEAGNG